ncbi:MAG: PTS sugar transporter subunit IIA [Gemmatimonadota bacterium]
MRLRDFLRPEHVILDLRSRKVEDTIDALVSRLRDRGLVTDGERLARALIEREAVHTTALGHGVAVPHATVPGLDRPLVLVAVSPDGVAFGPTGLDPVRVFFLVLSPEGRTGAHIKLLARLCRLVRHPGFIEGLNRAESAEAVLDEIERVDRAHV